MKQLLLTLLFLNTLTGFAQYESLKIFKFNPGPLITSTLSFGIESFNSDFSRSNEFTFGVRYNKEDDLYRYGLPVTGEENFESWRGLTASYARRFYIPTFKEGKENIFNANSSRNGVYMAPSLRLDYNNYREQRTFKEQFYDNDKQISTERTAFVQENTDHFGILPAVNFGVQFSFLQYGYVDLFVGGGLRMNFENVKERSRDVLNDYYSYGSGPIRELILVEGVRPTGGISVGVKF